MYNKNELHESVNNDYNIVLYVLYNTFIFSLMHACAYPVKSFKFNVDIYR